MRTYSSGMSARVAFSVAVHMKPDILMVDEALSTGDARFRAKANDKMAELRSSARAMFLVSHGLNSIKEMCTAAIWLDKGRLMMEGDPETVVEEYKKFTKVKKAQRPPRTTSEAVRPRSCWLTPSSGTGQHGDPALVVGLVRRRAPRSASAAPPPATHW